MLLVYAAGVVLVPGAARRPLARAAPAALARGAGLRRAHAPVRPRPPRRGRRLRASTATGSRSATSSTPSRSSGSSSASTPRAAGRTGSPTACSPPASSLLAARVPLSGYSAADGKTNAPTLFATARLEQAARRRRRPPRSSLALGVALLAGARRRWRAARPTRGHAGRARPRARSSARVDLRRAPSPSTSPTPSGRGADVLGSDPSFVDASGISDAAMLAVAHERARRRLRVPVLEPLRRRRLPAPGRRASRLLRGHPARRSPPTGRCSPAAGR